MKIPWLVTKVSLQRKRRRTYGTIRLSCCAAGKKALWDHVDGTGIFCAFVQPAARPQSNVLSGRLVLLVPFALAKSFTS